MYEHNEKSKSAYPAIHLGHSTIMVSGIKSNSVIKQHFHVTITSSFKIFILLTTYNKFEQLQNLSGMDKKFNRLELDCFPSLETSSCKMTEDASSMTLFPENKSSYQKEL